MSATLDALYYGFYVEGLRRAFGRARWRRPPLRGLRGMAFEVGGRRVYICAQDDAEIDPEPLAWCDAYGKVNARGPLPEKVVPIGPGFGVTAWSPAHSALVLASALVFRSERRPRATVADLRRQWRYRQPEPRIVPGATEADQVFVASTIWQKEAATNEARATFMRAVMARPELTLTGGFAPRHDGATTAYDELLAPRVDYPTYLERTRRSAFVFNTPAVLGCHGWKLAEYLALGKAIISTPLTNHMPAPFEAGIHYHPAEPTTDSIDAAIDALADGDYRRSLERNARRYYLDHLAPEQVIGRLVLST